MTEKQIRKIIDRLEFWYKKDMYHQDAIDEYCKKVHSGSHSPKRETTFTESFLDGLAMNLSSKIIGWLEYYIYEAKGMTNGIIRTKGKEYNASNKDEFIQFMCDEYSKKEVPTDCGDVKIPRPQTTSN